MKRKINLLVISLVIIAVIITGLLTHNLVKDSYLESVENNLNDTAIVLNEYLNLEEADDLNHLKALTDGIHTKNNQRITLIAEDGTVILDTNADESTLENHSDRPEIIEALAGDYGVSQRYSETVNRELLYIAIPAVNNTLGIEVVRVSMPLENITFYEMSLIKQILIASVIGIIIAFLIGIKFVSALLKPINELNEATQKISDGNFHNRIHIRSNDELSYLANNFNKMSQELESMMEEINERNNTTNAVLSSMNNSLIAIDKDNKILFLNRAFEEKFGINSITAKGKDLFTKIESERLNKYLKELLKDNDNNTIEFSSDDGRIFNIYSTNILENNDEITGTLITLQDVTNMKKLEKIRSDFVANVSHELRTPLTSIKGFIETLKDGAINDEQVREKFLDIIDMEVTRLTTLIEDVLVLSDIENNYLTSKQQKIDLAEMSYNVIDMLKPLANKKDINIEYDFDEDMPMIYANKSWTKQMIINLIDNAIKYSNENNNISVNLKHRLNNIVLIVEDEGIGIAQEDLERLFERFYRVDKARSRDLGGTGLGLAIVKHVVLALNGKVNVQSEPGKGTKFTINIPVNSFEN